MSEQNRKRTYFWDAPSFPIKDAAGKTGLEYLKSIEERGVQANPYWQTIGISKFEVLEPGNVRFTALPQEFHANIVGSVHGGFAASLLDSALATAAHSLLPVAGKMTTVQININYVRAIQIGQGEIFCLGEAIHIGRRLATAEAKIIDRAGKIYCHGSATLMIFE